MKLTVAMITYNHEPFIAQALDSVLMQQVSFDYEILVGEDCSTDRTREIVRAYQQRYPDKIRLQLPETNRGVVRNFVSVLQAARGEYIALLEGDDYWTVPQKLQRQVAFLDAHPECAICFHNVEVLGDEGRLEPWPYPPPAGRTVFTLEDVLALNFIPTCGAVFRRGLFGAFPAWFAGLKLGDWPLHILNAQYGTIDYLDAVMGVYRRHPGGAWSVQGLAARVGWTIEMYERFNIHFGYRYHALILRRQFEFHYQLAMQFLDEGDRASALAHTRACLALTWRRRTAGRALAKLLLRVVAPGVHARVRKWRKPAAVH